MISGISKLTSAWIDGSAIYYVLTGANSRFAEVNWDAFRHQLSLITVPLPWLEAALGILLCIFWPIPWLRKALAFSAIAFHSFTLLFLHLGILPLVYIACWLPFAFSRSPSDTLREFSAPVTAPLAILLGGLVLMTHFVGIYHFSGGGLNQFERYKFFRLGPQSMPSHFQQVSPSPRFMRLERQDDGGEWKPFGLDGASFVKAGARDSVTVFSSYRRQQRLVMNSILSKDQLKARYSLGHYLCKSLTTPSANTLFRITLINEGGATIRIGLPPCSF